MSGASAGPGRRGTTYVELLVVVLLTFLLAALAVQFVAHQRSMQETIAGHLRLASTVRTSGQVLRAEWGRLVPGRDLGPVSTESVSLRAFRGFALPCDEGDAEQLLVVVRGSRQPDPAKDSILVLDASGGWSVLGLLRASRAAGETCVAEGEVQNWVASASVPRDAVLLRYFERGSYHLTGAALRYRRGGGGRQPITGSDLATPPSGFVTSGGRLFAELVSAPGGLPWRIGGPRADSP